MEHRSRQRVDSVGVAVATCRKRPTRNSAHTELCPHWPLQFSSQSHGRQAYGRDVHTGGPGARGDSGHHLEPLSRKQSACLGTPASPQLQADSFLACSAPAQMASSSFLRPAPPFSPLFMFSWSAECTSQGPYLEEGQLMQA